MRQKKMKKKTSMLNGYNLDGILQKTKPHDVKTITGMMQGVILPSREN